MEENKQLPVKWLWGLFWLHVANCLLPLFGHLPPLVGSWYPWAQRVVSLGIVVCLYLLPGRYRLAGMAKALSLVCNLIALVVYPVLNAFGAQLTGVHYAYIYTALAGASELLALIAIGLEYVTHAATVPTDRKKWYIFLCCSLVITLATSVFVALVQPMLPDLNVQFIRFWNLGARTLSLAASIAYLLLLYGVINAQRKE